MAKSFSRAGFEIPGCPITTERLILRPIERADFPDTFEMDTNAEVMRYVPVPIPEEFSAYDQMMLKRLEPEGRLTGYLTVIKRDTGQTIGVIHLRPTQDQGLLELGFRFKPEFWSYGFASEGSKRLLEIAFNDLEADQVVAHVMAGNKASRRLLEQIGFDYVRDDLLDDIPVELFVCKPPA